MAQKEANHSSKDRTILWIIIPCTVAVSLLFTNLNHNMVSAGEKLSANFNVYQSSKTDVVKDTLQNTQHEVIHADTTNAVAHH